MRSKKKWGRNSPADTQVPEKGVEVDAPGTRVESPLQPMEMTMVKQIVPLQFVEDYGGADIHLAVHGALHIRACGRALEEASVSRELKLK